MDRRDVLKLLGLSPLAPAFDALGLDARALLDGAQTRPSPDVELALTAAPAELSVLKGAPTRVWRFTGRVVKGPPETLQAIPDSWLGPIIRLERGQRVRIRFRNQLDEPSIVHWHGLDVPELADGHPRLAVNGGREYVYDFEVTNRAGTYWYHPHPHQRTGAQVYQGLAGMLVVSDPEEKALGLPSGAGELVCVLQDRRFDADNQFMYASSVGGGMGMAGGRGMGGMGRGQGGRGMGMSGMAEMMQTMNGWLGDTVLVNGRLHPTVNVDRRTYRVRLLNGSNARIYKLAWSDDTPVTIIGSDGGLLERAREMQALTLAPGQRADVLLDLSDRAAGSELQLRSLAYPEAAVGRVGMMEATGPLPQGAPLTLMTLKVSNATGPRVRLPERLATPPAEWRVQPDAPVRRVSITFMQMNWLLGGRTFEMETVAPEETVAPGSTHVWEFRNEPNPMGMAMAHPVHLHGRQFRVLSRAGADGNALRDGISDSSANDTVLVLPGETVRVQVTFSTYPGLYLYHCHILEHEDMGMMRNFRIRA
ncbi:MAG: multicopper oxidase domain-containing protein [Acidobacteria bacterium]|nr:multicopper oxidase domain-containing protein [Acidobacteriota bacterium]